MKETDVAVAVHGYTTVREAMAYLRLSRTAVCSLMETGQLSYAKFGKARRLPWAALHEYGRRNTVAGVTG